MKNLVIKIIALNAVLMSVFVLVCALIYRFILNDFATWYLYNAPLNIDYIQNAKIALAVFSGVIYAIEIIYLYKKTFLNQQK